MSGPFAPSRSPTATSVKRWFVPSDRLMSVRSNLKAACAGAATPSEAAAIMAAQRRAILAIPRWWQTKNRPPELRPTLDGCWPARFGR